MLNRILNAEYKAKILILRTLQLVLMFIPGSLVCISGTRGFDWSATYEASAWSNETGRKICSMVGSVFLRPDGDGEHYIFAILMGLMAVSAMLSFWYWKKNMNEKNSVTAVIYMAEIILTIVFVVLSSGKVSVDSAGYNSDCYKYCEPGVLFYVILALMVYAAIFSFRMCKKAVKQEQI